MDKKFRFTDSRLSKTSPPDKGRVFYYDTRQPGLRLQVTPTGAKSFQLYTWSNTHKRPMTRTLGRYPAMTIGAAREQGAKELRKIQGGMDIVELRRQKKAEWTLLKAYHEWDENHVAIHRSRKYHFESQRLFKLHIHPTFGDKKVSEISSDTVEAWHRKLIKKKKMRGNGTLSAATANRCLALIRSIYSKTLKNLDNPAAGLQQHKEYSRDRFLRPEELKRFFLAVDAEPNRTIAEYLLVALFTGARRSNVLAMRWADIDFDLGTWTIPAPEVKNDEGLTIPMVPMVHELLAERKRTANSIYVFSGNGKTGHLQEPKSGWKRICDRAELKGVRLHDLRRTMGSYQTITGASTTVVGKTLGHKSQQATAVYARLNLDPVRASMEKAVEAMMEGAKAAKSDKNADVIKFRETVK